VTEVVVTMTVEYVALVRWAVMFLMASCTSGSSAPEAPPNEPSGPETNVPALSSNPMSVTTLYFNEIEIADGALAVMDGGTHGVQGHTVVINAGGRATWERRLEGLRPQGSPGSGSFVLGNDERALQRTWSNTVWDMAGPSGRARFFGDISEGPPRRVWAVVLRRGDEVRVVEGGKAFSPHSPEPLQPLLAWLVRRVDELAQQSP